MPKGYSIQRDIVPRRVWPGVIKGFKPTNPIYAFIFASIIGSMIAWVTVSANNSIDPAIRSKIKNKNSQRAAVWAANFAVAFITAMGIYLILYGLFGFGEGMTQSDPWSVRQILRILKKLNMKRKLPRKKLYLYPQFPHNIAAIRAHEAERATRKAAKAAAKAKTAQVKADKAVRLADEAKAASTKTS